MHYTVHYIVHYRQRLHRTVAYQAFLGLYDRFVREVLLPACAGHDMIYQACIT